MKKVAVIMALFFGISCPTLAQHAEEGRERDPNKMAEKRTEMMSQHLSLTEDQYSQVKQLNLETAMERQKHGQSIKLLNDEYDRKLALILNEDQMQKFEELKKERKHKNRERNNIKPSDQK